LQIKQKLSVDSKAVKQEVNGTAILPPLAFPELCNKNSVWPDEIFFKNRLMYDGPNLSSPFIVSIIPKSDEITT